MKKLDIMTFFPGNPRPVQEKALRLVQDNWDSHDVFVLSLPVASGKSKISQTIAKWCKTQSCILTPTNILVDQYQQEAKGFSFLKKKDSYTCHSHFDNELGNLSCAQVYKDRGGSHCGGCHYVRKVREAKRALSGIYNYHTYMALKMQVPVVIFDEAHKVLDTIRALSAKKVWQFQHLYPDWVNTYQTLYRWVSGKATHSDKKIFQTLKEDLEANSKQYLVKRGMEPYRGEERDCLSLLPLDVSRQPPIFWPNKVKKIVLMSGTISYKDIEAMGLDKRRVCYIDMPSPIEPEARPVIYQPVASMSWANQDANLEKLAQHLAQVAEQEEGKGLVHITYGLARKLRPLLPQERFLWHDSTNKLAVYKEFRETEEPRILMGSGLYEGIDLYGEDYKWQIITKVPYPSLAEPAIKFMAGKDPVWYHWETVKSVIQACGRICRGPEDSGTTYVIDSSWRKLYDSCVKEGLLPKWWLDAYQEHDVAPEHADVHLSAGAG